MKLYWRYGLIAGIFLAVFSLYPQMKMLYLRGEQWNGHYAYNDIDEVAYAAYVRALIDGRPRKNDPYSGRDHSAETPQDESLFSIQFAAPYTVALPARILGIGAPWAMTLSGAIAAFLAALAVFWIVGMITGNSLFGMAGSIVVLAGGAIFAGEGAIGEITGWSYAYPYFPGFRRYIPALAFPAFFLLVGAVWKLIGTKDFDQPKDLLRWTAAAIAAFAYAVFSYFYVWTTAAAWLGCVGICWLIARNVDVKDDVKRLLIIAAGSITVLVPYAVLLANRSQTMDHVQLLVQTRALDLARPPELIGFLVIAAIAVLSLFRIISPRDKRVLFTLTLSITPFIIFNQQVLTGQALQPIHYQVFIGNYVAGLALILLVGILFFGGRRERTYVQQVAAVMIAAVGVIWGFIECHYTVRILDDVNIVRDEALPVARRLDEIAAGDPAATQKVVLHLGIAEGDDFPTLAPQSVLWARHQHVFPGLSWEQNKERYYQFLYYQGVEEKRLADSIKRGGDFVSIIALFGWGRHTDRLNSDYKPLTVGEVDVETRLYGEYARNFDPRRGNAVPVDYLIVRADTSPDFSNVDKWYTRDFGEIHGEYILYSLQLR